MATHIETVESEVELVEEPSPPETAVRSPLLDQRTRRDLRARREETLRRRIDAEGCSD